MYKKQHIIPCNDNLIKILIINNLTKKYITPPNNPQKLNKNI